MLDIICYLAHKPCTAQAYCTSCETRQASLDKLLEHWRQCQVLLLCYLRLRDVSSMSMITFPSLLLLYPLLNYHMLCSLCLNFWEECEIFSYSSTSFCVKSSTITFQLKVQLAMFLLKTDIERIKLQSGIAHQLQVHTTPKSMIITSTQHLWSINSKDVFDFILILHHSVLF